VARIRADQDGVDTPGAEQLVALEELADLLVRGFDALALLAELEAGERTPELVGSAW
jgi:hypothetical protein